LPSTVVSHYRLLNPLGTGGMGVVFRAEDTALGRTVALKFLSPQIVHDPRRVDRFRDEARNASSLNHPNICTIYEVDEEDGELFIAMEYVEGRPLSEFLRGDGMPVDTILRYGRQLAGALEHAHERGIIHRDLKPLNIIVTPRGDAKILDFGLAKRTDAEEIHRKTLDVAPTETSAGLTGTLPYMAPEQLEGSEASARSDIWSLGVVLYEMASGVRPFRGDSLYRLCMSIMQDAPPALPERIPTGLASVIRRCLEKDPGLRYQRAGELRAALETLEPSGAMPAKVAPVAARKKFPRWAGFVVLAILAGLAIAGAWRYEKGRRQSNGIGLSGSEHVQLAVLPGNVGLKPEETAFDAGLVETLTSRLTQLTTARPLAVIPASEVRAKNATTIDAARAEFGINLGLIINVQHAAGQARVNYSLVDARSHEERRGGTITASMDDPFALQDRVAESIARALELQLQPQEKRTMEAHGTMEPAAYDFYLQGRGYLQDIGKLENVENAVTVFRRALEKDAGFAAASAGLGEAYWSKFGLTHEAHWTEEAIKACNSAVDHDAALADAHVCLGGVYLGTGQVEQAATEYQKAVLLDPTLDAAHAGLASAYVKLKRPDDAEKAYQQAISLRPEYWVGYNRLGTFYLRRGKYEHAAQMFSQVVSLAPDSFMGYNNLGDVRMYQGRNAEAIPLLQHSLEIRKTADATSNLGTAYFQLHRYAEAADAYEQATQLDPKNYVVWGNWGDAYYWAPGHREQAAAAYREAIALAENALHVNANDTLALSCTSVYHAMLGERAPALEFMRRAMRIEPKRPDVLLNSAIVYEQLGEHQQALDALEKAVAAGLDPAQLQQLPNFGRLRDQSRFQELLSPH
jgi:tetratricopeptide (TPR) repeat protein/predicted Ser/Thr protein kinase